MKLIKLAHPSQVRSIPENELDRLLAQGWVEIQKPVSRLSMRQRKFRRQRKAKGHKRFTAYLSPALFELLAAVKRPGEDNSGLLTRLLLLHADDTNSQEGKQN